MNWTCAAVRRRLCEYHDGELTIDQRVTIQEHLRVCVACEAEAQGLVMVSSGLRAAAARRACADDSHDLDGLAAGVVSRLRAEREESFGHTVQRMFEDLHLVWAALGATAATFACLAITVGIFYFSRAEHPDSLASMIDTMKPYSTGVIGLQSGVVLPRQEIPPPGARQAMPEVVGDEEIWLDTTITREGRVDMASLQLMNPDGPTAGEAEQTDWKSIGSVLDSVARARFAPGRVGGEPVAVKVFWYFTYTTVRPKAGGQVHHDAAGPSHVV